MARLFDDAQSEYLKIEQAVATGAPFAVSIWVKRDANVECVPFSLTYKESNTNNFVIQLLASGDNNYVRAFAQDSGGYGIATTTGGTTDNVWQHICALFVSSTDRRVLLNNAGKGVNTTDRTPSGINRTAIGYWGKSSPSLYFSGRIAEVAVWDLSAYPGANAGLKADYFETNILPLLAADESPLNFTTGLLSSWSFQTTSLDDEVDTLDLTASGTAYSSDHPSVICNLDGTITAQSGVDGNLQCLQELAGTIAAQSALVGDIRSLLVYSLAGLIEAQSSSAGNISSIESLLGQIAGLSTAAGNIRTIEILEGLIAAQSTVSAKLRDLSSLSGSLASQSSVTGFLVVFTIGLLSGTISAHSGLVANLFRYYEEIPPFIEKDLIDPFGSGAWLWLAQIAVPTKDTVRIARNTADVKYDGKDFDKFNLEVGAQTFSGDGSIPRITLRTFRDISRKIEDIINDTEGALGGAVKLIRVNEKFLDTPVAALEADYDLLASETDSEWCTFTIGIPNPLTQRFPLEDYSSSVCPWTSPALFKGPKCQYADGDTTCTGTYNDCRTKGNAIHWGAELGLSPSVAKE